MKVLIYSTKEFELPYLKQANKNTISTQVTSEPLSLSSCDLARGFDCISVFTADDASAPVIEKLAMAGVRFIAVRAAGYDNIDVEKAKALGIKIANVPGYSPNAVAEHAVLMMLALNRKLAVANEQVRHYNFSLDRLVGFDMNNKTVGIIGTGKIGQVVARILNGFGCNLLAYDINPLVDLEWDFNLRYTPLDDLLMNSDIITIHTPLNNNTRHLIDKRAIDLMKPNSMIVNTARGAVVDSAAIIAGLASGKIGAYGMDVYEKERGVFFYDRSSNPPVDETLEKFLKLPNVLVTPHQAFATREALTNIADTTFNSIQCWKDGIASQFEL
jgi:D-lactate dehydrogenase